MALKFHGSRVIVEDGRRLHIHLPGEDFKRIRDFTRSRGYSLSWFFRTLALQYIAREEKRLGK